MKSTKLYNKIRVKINIYIIEKKEIIISYDYCKCIGDCCLLICLIMLLVG